MKKKLSLEKQAENAFDDMRDKVSDIIEKCELDMTELIDNYNTKYEDVDEAPQIETYDLSSLFSQLNDYIEDHQ